MITRQQLIDGKASHRDYYGQFVSDDSIRIVKERIGTQRIIDSLDPHFGDIGIHEWRALGNYAHMVRDIQATGTFAAQTDIVCLYKETARQIRKQHATPRRHAIRVRFQGINDSLTADINGTVESIYAYYMQDGGMLNIGTGGEDRMAKVVGIDFLD